MDAKIEYGCSNGHRIVGAVGSRDEAQALVNRNYEAALRAGDRARYAYHLVQREQAVGLGAPGAWTPAKD